MEKPPDDQSPQSPDAIEQSTSRRAASPDSKAELIDPKQDPRKQAKTVLDVFGVSMQSGGAAALQAFTQLPESVQHKQLDHEAERSKQHFELAATEIASEERDREKERNHSLELRRLELSHQDKGETRTYRILYAVVVVVTGIVGYLLYLGQYALAAPIVSLLVGLGTGYVGGTARGYKQAQVEQQRASRENPRDESK